MRVSSIRLPLLALVAGLSLSAPGHAIGFGGESVAKVGKPAAFDPAAQHGAEAATHIWVNKSGGAKGVTKVVIPFFQVQFVTDSHADSTAVEGGGTTTRMFLKGPDKAQMQAIVDKLYVDFIARLTAAGLTVVTPTEAVTYPAWGQMAAVMKPSGDSVSGMGGVVSTFVSPAGMGYYLLPTTLPQFTGGGSFSLMATQPMIQRETALMQQSGAAVLGFRAVVDFASIKSSDKGLFGHRATVNYTKGSAGIAIRPVSTQMFLVSPNAKGTMMDPVGRMRFELQTPLLIETSAIQSINNTTTTGQRVESVLATGISLLGGGRGYSTQQWDVNVDAGVWAKDVAGALDGVQEMMVTRLKGEL